MTHRFRARIATAAAALLVTLLSTAAPHAQHHGKDKAMSTNVGANKLESLTIEAPWARASAGAAKAGAAYLRIVNAGTQDDRLVGASAPVAARVEFHTHRMNDGVMRMRRVEAVLVPGNRSAELKPGGHHLMLIGLNGPLKQGSTFPLTLTFENAGKITVPVNVRPITARGPGTKHHDHK